MSSGELTEPSAISTPSARSQAGGVLWASTRTRLADSGSRGQQAQKVRPQESRPAGDERQRAR